MHTWEGSFDRNILVNREGMREGLGKMGRTECWGAEIARAMSMVCGRVVFDARISILRGASQKYTTMLRNQISYVEEISLRCTRCMSCSCMIFI